MRSTRLLSVGALLVGTLVFPWSLSAQSAPVAALSAKAKAQIDSTRYVSIKELAEAYWLLVLTDETKVFEAVEALENYIKIEKDLLLKEKAQKNLQNLKSKLKIN